MSESVERVRRALRAAGLDAEIREMAASTRTAEDAARAAGCEVDQIAKSILFQGARTGELVLFLTAGGNRIDPGLASDLAGESMGRADAAAVRERTGFAIGGVAPVGHLSPLRSFWDPRLDDFALIWAAAGSPRHIFATAPEPLRRASGALRARFTA